MRVIKMKSAAAALIFLGDFKYLPPRNYNDEEQENEVNND